MRWRIVVTGTVQGVGFRPFICRLAAAHGVVGTVKNDSAGVVIDAHGPSQTLRAFIADITDQAPPQARIRSVTSDEVPESCAEAEPPTSMTVTASNSSDSVDEITADLAVCDRCVQEVTSIGDRRFGYPFNACADCGPRFSITASLPFDRPATSMDAFGMCRECQGEYDDVEDRRFLAQTISCPECGPALRLVVGDDQHDGPEALSLARRLLAGGAILAVKGVGGYQLMARADQHTIATLRQRKARRDRPFAVMFADLAGLRQYAPVDDRVADALAGSQAPIVITPVLDHARIAHPDIAPGLGEWGVMLPNSPLHHLLLAGIGGPVICTSANPRGSPMVVDDEQALRELPRFADAVLSNNRAIRHRVDDSIYRQCESGLIPMRRGRGQTPSPLLIPRMLARSGSAHSVHAPHIVAVGADLKASFSILRPEQILTSQYFGDLAHAQVHRAFVAELDDWLGAFAVRPELVVCDAHPDYVSTQFAERFAAVHGVPLLRVQHHRAHVAAVAAEHSVDPDTIVIGIALDGLGYGDDGTTWGGEAFSGTVGNLRHVGGLLPAPQPGGDLAVTEPWRMAAAYLSQAGIDWRALPMFAAIDPDRAAQCETQLRLGPPRTSSLGRVLDAVAFLVGAVGPTVEYDGQAPAQLEAFARRAATAAAGPRPLPFAVVEDGAHAERRLGLDLTPAWLELAGSASAPRPGQPELLALRWHDTIVAGLVEVAVRLRDEVGSSTLILAGGCLQNVILADGLRRRLAAVGFEVMVHRRLPTNDGAISIGQAWLGALEYSERGL
ncbi:MAG: carbamoyltransferase HypF [Actinomycetes bacterium]